MERMKGFAEPERWVATGFSRLERLKGQLDIMAVTV
jgi:hypothetical protein